MRTEKQVKLFCIQKGTEYETISKSLDSISLPENVMDVAKADPSFAEWMQVTHNCYPILPEGVLNIDPPGEGKYSYLFKIEESGNEQEFSVSLTVLLHTEEKDTHRWLFDALVDMVVGDEIQTKISFTDANLQIMEKQKRNTDAYRDKRYPSVQQFVQLFIFLTAYINYRMAHAETKMVQRKHQVESHGSVGNTTKQSASTKREIVLDGIRIIASPGTKLGHKYHRTAESWNVRGHYRRYKNGKIVYVKPFQKGKGRKQAKNYTLSIERKEDEERGKK